MLDAKSQQDCTMFNGSLWSDVNYNAYAFSCYVDNHNIYYVIGPLPFPDGSVISEYTLASIVTQSVILCSPMLTTDHTRWRRFIPAGQTSVELVSTSKSNACLSFVQYVALGLLNRCIIQFLSDTNVDLVFIVGQPDIHLVHTSRGIKCCWVYDYYWDDDFIDDFILYPCLDDAYS